jgi:hypothetical protein
MEVAALDRGHARRTAMGRRVVVRIREDPPDLHPLGRCRIGLEHHALDDAIGRISGLSPSLRLGGS